MHASDEDFSKTTKKTQEKAFPYKIRQMAPSARQATSVTCIKIQFRIILNLIVIDVYKLNSVFPN